MTTRRSTRLVSLALLLLWTVPALANDDALVVHEWGTFTCLQDENGKGIGGINTDDEPVPDFVHNIVPALLIPVSSNQPLLSKSVPRCHTDVTMRLETPVIYFHPGKDFAGRFNVTVDLNHGWLTQFFPDAQAHAFGINGATVGSLEHYGHGSLEWRNIALGQSEEGPATRSLVWTTPRGVNAATV